MALTANYLFIVSMDVEPEHEDLFNEVYDTEHVPNICKVPGVITAYRLKLEEAELSVGSRAANKSAETPQKYMAIYELERADIPGSDAWAAQAEIGLWPTKVRPHTFNRRHELRKIL
ncbi:MAG: hypothetical protein CMP14_10265 [Rickettsiales bacterium]|nr:hypothetical protein [Rickettsiales bacterium]